jgi:hypothetical protein
MIKLYQFLAVNYQQNAAAQFSDPSNRFVFVPHASEMGSTVVMDVRCAGRFYAVKQLCWGDRSWTVDRSNTGLRVLGRYYNTIRDEMKALLFGLPAYPTTHAYVEVLKELAATGPLDINSDTAVADVYDRVARVWVNWSYEMILPDHPPIDFTGTLARLPPIQSF